jgi:ABC-type sugar transport system permease subunit
MWETDTGFNKWLLHDLKNKIIMIIIIQNKIKKISKMGLFLNSIRKFSQWDSQKNTSSDHDMFCFFFLSIICIFIYMCRKKSVSQLSPNELLSSAKILKKETTISCLSFNFSTSENFEISKRNEHFCRVGMLTVLYVLFCLFCFLKIVVLAAFLKEKEKKSRNFLKCVFVLFVGFFLHVRKKGV